MEGTACRWGGRGGERSWLRDQVDRCRPRSIAPGPWPFAQVVERADAGTVGNQREQEENEIRRSKQMALLSGTRGNRSELRCMPEEGFEPPTRGL